MNISEILDGIKAQQENYRVHSELFNIYEGNLNHYLDQWLSAQISGNSVKYAKIRKCPINLLRKIVDKLSQLYTNPPRRVLVDGTPTDELLFEVYEDQMKPNKIMNIANEFFNMSRATLIQPYVHQGQVRLRAIPNDRFFVYSDDPIDPMNVTAIAVCQGQDTMIEKQIGNNIFHIYSDEEFLIVDSSGKVRRDLMNEIGNIDGINSYSKIPFVYINRSTNNLIPPPDLEMRQVVLLVAGLMTDLNFASMFSLFSIMYGIDIKDENLVLAPNAFWNLKSDPATDKKPEIGTVKNEADVAETLELVRSQLSMFLNSRSIKTSAIGDLETSNFASGISKLLDEGDATEEKKKQMTYFKQAESDLWDLVLHYMHPVWVGNQMIDTRLTFSPNCYVETIFAETFPMQRRGDLVRDLKDELDAGLITTERAIKILNPNMAEEEVAKLLAELGGSNQIEVIERGTTEDTNQTAEVG